MTSMRPRAIIKFLLPTPVLRRFRELHRNYVFRQGMKRFLKDVCSMAGRKYKRRLERASTLFIAHRGEALGVKAECFMQASNSFGLVLSSDKNRD